MSRYFYMVSAVSGIILAIFIYTHKPSQNLSTPLTTMAEFGGVSLKIEYATSTVAREIGLSGKENLPDDYGMLFVFPKDDYYGIWMKDMIFPIDIFWLDNKGQVISVVHRVATSTYPTVFYPTAQARYVLETVAGFAEANSIATGTPLRLKN
jgi:uncharacterized membrane protein (UPF0127 family)